MKEKLVDHLQTQIQDLERFVEFLQGEAEGTVVFDVYVYTLANLGIKDIFTIQD